MLTVAFAPAKGDRPEWVVQKLTELGVDRIVPLQTARSVVRWDGERGRRAVERLRRVAREAAAQSRRAYLPEVSRSDLAALAEPPPGPAPVARAELGGPPPAGDSTVAVGPEGGWSDEERRLGRPDGRPRADGAAGRDGGRGRRGAPGRGCAPVPWRHRRPVRGGPVERTGSDRG